MGNLGDRNKKTFARNLSKYIDLSGQSRYEICKSTGVPYSTLTDWLNQTTYPRFDKIEILAEYFGVNTSDLIEEERNMGDVGRLLAKDKRISKLILNYSKLNSRDADIIDNLIESMLKKEQED